VIEISLSYNKNLIKNAKSLRKNATPQERKLWYEFLAKYPVRFQRQKVIDNYIVDFFCAKARLVIELDGSGHYQSKQFEYDTNRTGILRQYGIKVLRFTNRDINENFSGACTAIDIAVKKHLPQSPTGDISL